LPVLTRSNKNKRNEKRPPRSGPLPHRFTIASGSNSNRPLNLPRQSRAFQSLSWNAVNSSIKTAERLNGITPAKRLRTQNFSSFSSARTQYFPSVFRAHSFAEPVHFLTFAHIGPKCRSHRCIAPPQRNTSHILSA